MTTQIKGPKLLYQRIKVLDKKGKKIAYEWFKNKRQLCKQDCYTKSSENLSELNMYFTEAFSILLFSSKL